MNKKLIAFLSILSLFVSLPINPVNAIENGADAVDNSVVVQIQLTFSNFSTTCSGALMAPRIVVTADHCIKLVGESNKNNLIQSAKVAPAGAARDIQTSSYIKVTDFIFTPREGGNGAAFLVLESALDLKLPVRIASASDIDNLQSNKSPIRFIGYGTTDKNQTVYKNSPQFAEGELFKDLENSHVHFRSNPGAPCAGDSGGPVIQELEKETLLIGLIQGPWYLDGKSFCPIEIWNPQGVRQDNIYKYSVYIPLYTSDAVSDTKLAADKVLATPAKPNTNSTTSDYDSVMADYKKLIIRLESLKRRYINNTALVAMEKKMLKLPIGSGDNLSTAIYNIESVNKKIDSSIKVWDQLYLTKIECVKGNTTKKVTAKNPKCPSGYKKAS
jgi:hypothetical protein